MRFQRFSVALLWTSVASSGAVLMALEILAFRLIGKTFGSALRETSMVISVFLCAMALGYYAGGRIIDRRPKLSTLMAALGISSLSIAVVPALDAVVAPAVYSSSIPIALHAGLVSLLIFFVPTALLASTSPLAIRLFAIDAAHSGSNAGRVSAVSTFGSIFGSIGTAFFLIDFFGSITATLYALSAITAFMTLVLLLSTYAEKIRLYFATAKAVERTAWIAFAVAVLGVSLIGGVRYVGDGEYNASIAGSPTFGNTVQFERDSAFHHIIVRDFNRTRNLYFDLSLESSMQLDDEYGGGAEYTRFYHFARLLRPDMRRTLFIGLGGGTGPKEFVHDYGVSADSVDVDPLVIDVAQRFFHVVPSAQMQLILMDGRLFVSRSNSHYDVIVVDAYSTSKYGTSLPPQLSTQEFFQQAAKLLGEDGLLVYNCAAPSNSVLAHAFSKTLYQVFPFQLTFDTKGNTVFFASRRDIRIDPEKLRTKTEALVREGVLRDPHFVQRAGQIAHYVPSDYFGVPVLTDDYAPVDTLLRRSGR